MHKLRVSPQRSEYRDTGRYPRVQRYQPSGPRHSEMHYHIPHGPTRGRYPVGGNRLYAAHHRQEDDWCVFSELADVSSLLWRGILPAGSACHYYVEQNLGQSCSSTGTAIQRKGVGDDARVLERYDCSRCESETVSR